MVAVVGMAVTGVLDWGAALGREVEGVWVCWFG